MNDRWDLMVVGAGPVGLAASRAASSHGLRVVVVDERRTLGGSVSGELGVSAEDPSSCWLTPAWGGPEARAALDIYRVQHGADRVVLDALAWGIFPGWTLAVSHAGATERFDADQVILATGSFVTRPVFPGHQLPGVVSPLGLQRALERGEARAGERLAILGEGPRVEVVVARAQAAGLEVVALLHEGGEGGGSLRLPSLRLVAPPRAVGARRLHHLDAPCADGDQRLAVDWCCVCGPQSQAAELANMAGVRTFFRGYHHGYQPERGPDGRTEAPGVFVAVAPGTDAPLAAALLEGEIVGTAAALRAGHAPARALDTVLNRKHFEVKPPPPTRALSPLLQALPHPEVVACHCTGHTFRDVLEAIDAGARSLDDVKRQAKVGLGPCQGRDCHRLVTRALELHGKVDVGTLHAIRVRPPVRPLKAAAMWEGEQA